MAASLAGLALAAIVAFAALTLWLAARNEARARADFPPAGQMVEVAGTRIHAEIIGQGPDLVLIHGSSGNTRDMSLTLAPLLAKSYRVILFDRPGLGHSARLKGDESIAAQAAVLSEAAQKLGAGRPIVLGHSYGGAVALAWAVQHPDRLSALVPVSAAAIPWDTPLPRFYKLTSSAWGSRIVVPWLTAWTSPARIDAALAGVFAPQPVPAGYGAHFGPSLSLQRSVLRANASQRASLLEEVRALQPRYGDIAVPTEIVHGSADTTVGLHIHSEPLSRQIPGAVLTRLENVGHMPHHSHASEVAAAIDRAAARAGLR